MGKSQIVILLAAGLFALAAGCQMAAGPSDEAQITAALGQWKAALEAQDLDKIMEPFSEEYQGVHGETKEEERIILEDNISTGLLQDVVMEIEDARITFEGDRATVGPIRCVAPLGEARINRILKKESDGIWRIIGTDLY
ncbi:MAG: YybH family protein [Planctomycetota bacterium]